MSRHEEIDEVSGVETTGHAWDGIKELNNPLPRWWVSVFIFSIIWSIGYWVAYPAWPTIRGYTAGVLKYSTREEIVSDLASLTKSRGATMAALADVKVADIEKNPELLIIARAQGKAAFGDNCVPCHGTGASGSKGFPNLNDDDWLWGGTVEQVMQTIQYGIRSGHEKAHDGSMLAFGRDGILKGEEIVTVASYVRSLSGLKVERKFDAAAGQKIFSENCVACHGAEGKGNPDVGAPNLVDKIWLYGSDEASVIETITNGRSGVMPAWSARLDPTTIKALAVYVHSLGGGK